MHGSSQKGFTLIELIISISILTILSVGIVGLLKAGLDSWIQGEAESVLQTKGAEIFNMIIEGNFKFDGVRESLDVVGGSAHKLVYVPWWEQPVSYANKGDKIRLNRKLHELSPVPILQMYDHALGSYRFVEVLYYPSAQTLGDAYSYVKVDQNIGPGDRAKLFYYPEINTVALNEISMSYEWDTARSTIVRDYQGKKTDLLKHDNIRVKSFLVSFLDGLNEPIQAELSGQNAVFENPISAVRMVLELEKNGHSLEFRTLTSLRKKSQSSTGILMTPGGKMKIPNSKNIKTFSIINFGHFEDRAELECLITSEEESLAYLLHVSLEYVNSIPWVTGYYVESPRGKKIYENKNRFPASRGINFLTLDHSGRYDYGMDENIDSEIQFKGDHVQFEMLDSAVKSVRVIVR